jgi:hypothetical protein
MTLDSLNVEIARDVESILEIVDHHLPVVRERRRGLLQVGLAHPLVLFGGPVKPTNAVLALAGSHDVRDFIDAVVVESLELFEVLAGRNVFESGLAALPLGWKVDGNDGWTVAARVGLEGPELALLRRLNPRKGSPGVLVDFAQSVFHVDDGYARTVKVGRELWGIADPLPVLVLDADKVPHGGDFVSSDVWSEDVLEATGRTRAGGCPFIFGEVDAGDHIEVHDEPTEDSQDWP